MVDGEVADGRCSGKQFFVIFLGEVVLDDIAKGLGVEVRETLQKLLTSLVLLNGFEYGLWSSIWLTVLIDLLCEALPPILLPYPLLQLLIRDDVQLVLLLHTALLILHHNGGGIIEGCRRGLIVDILFELEEHVIQVLQDRIVVGLRRGSLLPSCVKGLVGFLDLLKE